MRPSVRGAPITTGERDLTTMVDLAGARAAKELLRVGLGGRDRIRGIGIGAGDGGYELCVDVYRADAWGEVPSMVAGVPVRVRVRGPLLAMRRPRRSA